MAIVVPDVPFMASARSGERRLYDALRTLPDAYRVFHSVTYYLWPESGAPKDEGEADFVLLHPTRGLLIIEVKGGLIRYEGRERRWFSTDKAGIEHPVEDPFRQAQRHEKALARALSPHFTSTLPHGHAVCFPDCVFGLPDEKAPAGQPRQLVLDARSFTDFQRAVDSIHDAWALSGAHTRLSDRELKRAAQNVLAPRFNLSLPLKVAISGEAESFILLASEQVTCLDFLELNRRAVVEGGAGSGKTLVALEAARRSASRGERTLLLCFNKPLSAFLKERVAAAELPAGLLQVAAFHDACRHFCEIAGIPWPDVPATPSEKATFYDLTIPALFDRAAERVSERFHTIIVDEAQDFRTEWWRAVESLMADPETARLVLFRDPDQDLWERNGSPPASIPRFPLRLNQRNTLSIARRFSSLTDATLRLSPLAPEGTPPVERTYADMNEERRLVEIQIEHVLLHEKLDLSDVVILGTRHLEDSFLAGDARLCGFPVQSIDEEGRVAKGALRYATPRRFKGLEATVVFVCDIDGSDYACSRRDLYVAMSRAVHRLYLFRKLGYAIPDA